MLAGALWASSLSAFGFQPLITDDTGTQGPSGNQIEITGTETRKEAPGNSVVVRTLPVIVTHGLSDRVDVFVQANETSFRDSSAGTTHRGGGNPSFGMKWRFYENEADRTSFGFKPEILLPVSSDAEAAGLGHGRTSFNLTALLTQETSFGAVHANVVAGWHRNRDVTADPDIHSLRFSIAPVWKLSEHWKIAVDFGMESATAGGERTRSRFAEAGGIYSPNSNVDVAFGLVRMLERGAVPAATNVATAGITWRFR
jgi:hypothetical protein